MALLTNQTFKSDVIFHQRCQKRTLLCTNKHHYGNNVMRAFQPPPTRTHNSRGGRERREREESLPVESGSGCREARTRKKGERESRGTFSLDWILCFWGGRSRRRPCRSSFCCWGEQQEGQRRRRRCSRLVWSTTAQTAPRPAMGHRAPAPSAARAGRAWCWRQTPSRDCAGQPTCTSASSTPSPSSGGPRVSRPLPLPCLSLASALESNEQLFLGASMGGLLDLARFLLLWEWAFGRNWVSSSWNYRKDLIFPWSS